MVGELKHSIYLFLFKHKAIFFSNFQSIVKPTLFHVQLFEVWSCSHHSVIQESFASGSAVSKMQFCVCEHSQVDLFIVDKIKNC